MSDASALVAQAMHQNEFCTLVEVGMLMVDAGEAEEAVMLLSQACTVKPGHDDIEVHLMLAELATDPSMRIEHARRYTEMQPADPYGWLQLGNFYDRGGDVDAALAAYCHGHAADPSERRLISSCGRILLQLGREKELLEIADTGVANGALHSSWQLPPHLVHGLSAYAWRDDVREWRVAHVLEANFVTIQREVMAAMLSGRLQQEGSEDTEGLLRSGRWTELNLIFEGVTHSENCKLCPETVALIEREIPEAASMVRGAVKVSVLTPGSVVRPHHGPSNTRMRTHLGVRIPEGAYIRAGNPSEFGSLRQWQEGRVLCFDDSFRHEVWHEGSEPRVVLIVDVWHPDMDHQARLSACDGNRQRQVYLTRYNCGKAGVGWD
eukprot:gnl/TRDRNA2_/TRDRNA2_92645_c1_seq1.p1 gnl/TRDRNA2_/TRDRNA2_92645_c1~~gnl/TRDRNA2_/TRDRNA2_92645_c1_seq1.p1  ORF type:complete len:379 (+),score=42.67 gnl/TRDRNA2_/TRDRNA2_92645_c1_seq1:56-1192(+)